jgi:hypothetical protein
MTASECLARITGGDTIQSYRIPLRMLVLRAFGLNRDNRTRTRCRKQIENMKDWSASEEAFSNSMGSTWLSLFGGQKVVLTNHPI